MQSFVHSLSKTYSSLIPTLFLAAGILFSVSCDKPEGGGGGEWDGDTGGNRGKPAAVVGKGDRLEIFVKEDPEFGGKYLVRERGDIIIPEVGRIPLEGKTLPGIKAITG